MSVDTALFDAQEMVRDFHKKFGLAAPEGPTALDEKQRHLRATLILEEANETAIALAHDDSIETIDGLCDLIYVAVGVAVQMGVDLSPFFEEVHRTNMAKEGGATRADGKILKPPGWQPPDIAGILAEQCNHPADFGNWPGAA